MEEKEEKIQAKLKELYNANLGGGAKIFYTLNQIVAVFFLLGSSVMLNLSWVTEEIEDFRIPALSFVIVTTYWLYFATKKKQALKLVTPVEDPDEKFHSDEFIEYGNGKKVRTEYVVINPSLNSSIPTYSAIGITLSEHLLTLSTLDDSINKYKKTIYYKNITSIHFLVASSSLHRGYLQFSIEGEGKVELDNQHSDSRIKSNKIVFPKEYNTDMQELKDYIDYKINTTSQPVENKATDVSDELRKLKALVDDQVITQEDFDLKKKELLGL